MSKESEDLLATPAVEPGATPKPPTTSLEYSLQAVVIVVGIALGAIVGFFIALSFGWFPLC